MCLSSPSVPSYTPEPTPAPVQYTAEDQRKLRDDAAEKARKAAGLAGTNVTGSSGLTQSATVKTKTLLGQ